MVEIEGQLFRLQISIELGQPHAWTGQAFQRHLTDGSFLDSRWQSLSAVCGVYFRHLFRSHVFRVHGLSRDPFRNIPVIVHSKVSFRSWESGYCFKDFETSFVDRIKSCLD